MTLELSDDDVRRIASAEAGWAGQTVQITVRDLDALLSDRATLIARVTELEGESRVGTKAVDILVENTDFLSEQHDRELAERDREIDRLRAVVAKLPTTADGVPIVPGMEVQVNCGFGMTLPMRVSQKVYLDGKTPMVDLAYADPQVNEPTRFISFEATKVFSTREAAEAAKGASK